MYQRSGDMVSKMDTQKEETSKRGPPSLVLISRYMVSWMYVYILPVSMVGTYYPTYLHYVLYYVIRTVLHAWMYASKMVSQKSSTPKVVATDLGLHLEVIATVYVYTTTYAI